MFYENYKPIMMTLTVVGIILVVCRDFKGTSKTFKEKCDGLIRFTLLLFVIFNINPLLDTVFEFFSIENRQIGSTMIDGWLKVYFIIVSMLGAFAVLVKENSIKPLNDKYKEICTIIIGLSFFLMAIVLFPVFIFDMYQLFF